VRHLRVASSLFLPAGLANYSQRTPERGTLFFRCQVSKGQDCVNESEHHEGRGALTCFLSRSCSDARFTARCLAASFCLSSYARRPASFCWGSALEAARLELDLGGAIGSGSWSRRAG